MVLHTSRLKGMCLIFHHTRGLFSGTSRWGEYGEGGLLWGECSRRNFEWFEGDPVADILSKVPSIYMFALWF